MKKIGKQSVNINTNVSIFSSGSIVGKKENEGPLSKYFDRYDDDAYFGEDSWEKAEVKILKTAMDIAVEKSGLQITDIDYILSGDLLNQSMSSTFAVKDFNLPYLGLFGACSSIGLGLSLSSMLIDGEFAQTVMIGASSHFCTAEKQFRSPLGLGSQRNLTTTWTVTGSGAMIIKKTDNGPFIRRVTTGKIVDMGIKDAFNMGAAMAPSAYDTIKAHHEDFGLPYDYYDLIITGDLGYLGSQLVLELFEKDNIFLKNLDDCGKLIFDKEKQDTHEGGSGCGCSAVTFSGLILDRIKKGELKKVLFIPTGALMSSTSVQQDLSIPCISHAVGIENE